MGKDKPDVILLHVIAEFPTHHFIDRPARSIKTGEKTTLSRYLKEVYELMEESAVDALVEKSDAIKKSSDFEIKTKVLSDHISDTIIEFAKTENVNLIVIGNVGRASISRIKTLG
ncbi:MAG TPA: universal stress protein, partial [Nitrososphaera sp.]|nr:universal stress protein [Nitrososphaera sp.]